MPDYITAPYDNTERAMYVWHDTFWRTTQALDDLIQFCQDHDVTHLFVDTYSELGAANYSAANVVLVQTLVERCHDEGIGVSMLAGSTDWGHKHDWVNTNIIAPWQAYQRESTEKQRFDSIIYDIEYWTLGLTDPQEVEELKGVFKLMDSTRAALNIPVGMFAPYYRIDDDLFTYHGVSAFQGEHMILQADFVAVSTSRDTASSLIGKLQPWFDYAEANGGILYNSVETKDVSPDKITFYGQTKTYMESVLESVTDHFGEAAPFLGHAIHDYEAYQVMSA